MEGGFVAHSGWHAILYWMYRGFDFKQVEDVLLHKMSWTWMLLSFPFGISAQVFRGWRWKQSLEPLGEKARSSISIYSIFLSYALSLVIPRAGEFARCGVLKKWDDVSFPKALACQSLQKEPSIHSSCC